MCYVFKMINEVLCIFGWCCTLNGKCQPHTTYPIKIGFAYQIKAGTQTLRVLHYPSWICGHSYYWGLVQYYIFNPTVTSKRLSAPSIVYKIYHESSISSKDIIFSFSFLGNKPCVGMCYYKKVLALNNKIERQNAENEVMEVGTFNKCVA